MPSSVSNLSSTPRNWALYTLLLGALTWACFGNLRFHLLETHDFETFRDNANVSADFAYFFSAEKEQASGRLLHEFSMWLAHAAWGQNPAAFHLLVVALHFAASLLLCRTFMRAGADLELSMLAGLFFLLNVAHFRAVHWLSGFNYVLAFVLTLATVLAYLRFVATGRTPWLAACYASLVLGAFSHLASLMAWPFCLFLAWQQGHDLRRASRHLAPFALLLAPVLALVLHFTAKRTSTWEALDFFSVAGLWDLVAGIARSTLFFASRLLSTAHWLPLASHERHTWEFAVGALVLVGLAWLIWKKQGPAALWAGWTLLMLLPFVLLTEESILDLPVGPSRYLYLPSAGTALIIAWALRRTALALPAWRHAILGGTTVALIFSSHHGLHQAEALSIYSSARYYIANGNMEVGLERLHAVLAGNTAATPLPEVYFRLACIQLYLNKDPDPALREALALFPDALWLNLVKSLIDQENDSTLIQQRGQNHLAACIEQAKREGRGNLLATNLASLLHNMGKGYFRKEDYPRAIHAFERVLEIKPDKQNTRKGLGDTYAELGFQYFEQNRHDLAIEAYQQALYLNPDDRLARISLGWLFYFQGRWQEAIDQHRLALEHEVDADAQFALGLAYLANGDDRAAQTTYAQGIRLFGAEDAQQIGALQSLDALIKNSEENIVAREIRMTYWP